MSEFSCLNAKELANSCSFLEREISYSINFSQDLLYILLNAYISNNFVLHEKYTDFVNVNDVRTRLSVDSNTNKIKIVSTLKTPQSLRRFVYINGNGLVPLVDRTAVEQIVTPQHVSLAPVAKLKRIVSTRVYKPKHRPEIEIKFEQTYMEKNVSDKFDSLIASKQIALLNLLQNKKESLSKQSFLGSDEILANIRLEYEYVNQPDDEVLATMVAIIAKMDSYTHYQNISPCLPYTTIQNNIIYRKFVDERLLYNMEDVQDVYKWAIKLDGVRGRGIFTRNFMIVFIDDMQMFSGTFPWLFSINNVVAFQCELLSNGIMYITDILHVFKYTYNNRLQYECCMEPYDVDPVSALNCINYLRKKVGETNCQNEMYVTNLYGKKITVKFQSFNDPPLAAGGYCSVPTDGFVVLDTQFNYVKYKSVKTVELEYNAENQTFYDSNGPLNNRIIMTNDVLMTHLGIYEVVVTDHSIMVIKPRPDRLVPQNVEDLNDTTVHNEEN